MNTRCYRCGWSFSLNREALEEAAVASAGQKAHAMHCPRCRQAIRIPMDQVMRALPPGWAPTAATGEQATPATEPAEVAVAAAAGPAAAESAGSPTDLEPADSTERPQRRHRHSGKTHIGDSATDSAAKKSTHPN